MIKLLDVTKCYGDTTAIQHFNLQIKEGELVVLKGASGSGKSTILSLISALLKPTSGDVVVDGQSISKMPEHFAADFRRKHIGFIFQRYNLIANMSVWNNLLLPLIPDNLLHAEIEKRIQTQLEYYHLTKYKDSDVTQLSGGEQQRVAIARANVNNPKIILADEPTSNLDTTLAHSFVNQIQKMKEAGKTIVVATHDPLFFELDFVDSIYEIQT